MCSSKWLNAKHKVRSPSFKSSVIVISFYFCFHFLLLSVSSFLSSDSLCVHVCMCVCVHRICHLSNVFCFSIFTVLEHVLMDCNMRTIRNKINYREAIQFNFFLLSNTLSASSSSCSSLINVRLRRCRRPRFLYFRLRAYLSSNRARTHKNLKRIKCGKNPVFQANALHLASYVRFVCECAHFLFSFSSPFHRVSYREAIRSSSNSFQFRGSNGGAE